MENQKERIMELMRKGIITESEAIELLEKAGLAAESYDETAGQTDTGDKQNWSGQADKDGYQTNSSEPLKQFVNQAGTLMKQMFQTAKKSVDNNVDFSNGFPSLKHLKKSEFKAFEGEIKDLTFNATSGDVTVLTKDIEKTIVEVTYKVYGGVTEAELEAFLRNNVIIELEQGELIVKAKSKRIVLDMTITLATSQLEDASFDLVNGTLNIENLQAETLTVKKVNGDLTVMGGAFETVAVKAVNGDLRVAADFETADMTNVNGEVVVTTTAINAENLKVKNVNGDVKISVPDNIGLVGYVKTTFGKYKTRIALDNPLEITKNGAALVRTATNSLTLDIATNTGNIWLKDGQPAYPTTPNPPEQAGEPAQSEQVVETPEVSEAALERQNESDIKLDIEKESQLESDIKREIESEVGQDGE
jgi:DUF4097 and DUF4098 domain-containing protein YvlB